MKIRLGPDGIHLFDRKSGTNILLDEAIPPISSWTNSPRQVSIALTNSCNLNCTHCYASKKSAALNFSILKKWMLELDHAGCFSVGFGGGEPTLYPYFEELCRFGKDNTDLAITMTSHGHQLNESLIESLKESVDFIRISMDGVGHTYEEIRSRSFSSLLNKLALLEGQIPFGINFVVNDSTIIDLQAAAEIATKYQASELLLLPEQGVGRGKSVSHNVLMELHNWIKSYRGNLQLSISAAHRSIVNSQSILPKELDDIAFVHIDANGILKRCSFENKGEIIDDKGVMHAFNNLIKNRNKS